MARLASRIIGGYYAAPEELTKTLISLISAPEGARILDPCAADGTALLQIADGLKLTPYANELNEDRAKALRQTLAQWQKTKRLKRGETYSLNTDYRQVEFRPEMMSCLFLNPPYDVDEGERLELKFLKHFTPALQDEGLLIFIIPLSALASFRLVSYLLAQYDVKRIAKSTEEMFERFGQVVIVANKRAEAVEPSEYMTKRYRGLGDADNSMRNKLNLLSEQKGDHFTMPDARPREMGMTSLIWEKVTTLEDALAEAKKVGLWNTDTIQPVFTPKQGQAPFQPLMPLTMGHLTRLLAGGFIDNQVLVRPDGERMLIRGDARKEVSTTEKSQETEDGELQKIRTHRQRPTAAINLLSTSDGFAEVKPQDLGGFMKQYADQLVSHVAESYEPLYQFDDAPLKKKLGRRGNLYPVQKHIAMAACTSLKKHREAIIVGEMGTGKTRTGIVTALGSGAKRVLIYCPPHLAKKWAREAKLVWPEIEVTQLKKVGDVDKWMAKDAQARPQIGVMKFTTGSLGSGWRLAYNYWQPYTNEEINLFCKKPEKYVKEMKLLAAFRRRTKFQKGLKQPDTGANFLSKDDVPYTPYTLPSKTPLLRVSNGGSYPHRRALGYVKTRLKKSTVKKPREYYAPAYQLVRRRDDNSQSGFREHALREKTIRQQQAANYDPPKGGRYPLAEYIKRKYKNRIDLLVVDEVHQLKGGDTDRGYALHRLASSSKMSLALTGTIFGGYSSTLFHILWRTARKVRQQYTNNERNGRHRIGVSRWMNDYGFVGWTEKETIDAGTGKTTTNSKTKGSNREAPGSMPQMLEHLLPITAFMSLKDLSDALPDYEEIPVPVTPTTDILSRAQEFESRIGEKMRERLVNGDRSLMGSYLIGSICMPDAPWRDEIVIDPHTKNDETPHVLAHIKGNEREEDQLWPKEEAILELIEKEVKEGGRRCLLLVQQTGIRNIQPVWAKLLRDRGLKPAILTADADKREAWIEKQYKEGVNVIISNPRKVETGLDLIEFPTIIWSGTEFSIYTIQQASRRAWRLIQKKPCKTYFFYYEDTMQETALQLISRKLAAAAKVNGDALDGGLAEDDDGGSIEAQLADMAAKGEMKGKGLDLKAQFQKVMTADREAQSFIGVEIPDDPEEDAIQTIPWVDALMPALEVIGKGLEKYKNPYTARQQLNFMGNERVKEIALYLSWWNEYKDPDAKMPTPRQWFAAGYLWRSSLIAESVREVKDPLVKNRLERMVNYIADGQGRWENIHEQVEREADQLLAIFYAAEDEDTAVPDEPTVEMVQTVAEEVKQADPPTPPVAVDAQPVYPKPEIKMMPKERKQSVMQRPVIEGKRKKKTRTYPWPVDGRYPIMGTRLTYGSLVEWVEAVERLKKYVQDKKMSEKQRNLFLGKALDSLNPVVIGETKTLDELARCRKVVQELAELIDENVGYLGVAFWQAHAVLK